MKAFHFPLQRVLDWRALQLRTEEEKLSAIQNKLAEVLHRENALLVAELNAEMNLLGQSSVEGVSRARGVPVASAPRTHFPAGKPQTLRKPSRRAAKTLAEGSQRLQNRGKPQRET
jgi:hypothetical protein